MIEQTIDIPIDVPLLPYKIVQVGDLSCIYEAGNLRYIKCGDVELLRMMYAAVRDENWETIIPTIEDEKWSEHSKGVGVSISYTASYAMDDIRYKAAFAIDINHNSIVFTMKGTALSSFKKNRIGLCVLHPLPECKGKPVEITKPGGEIYQGVFPELISPHQPFKEIQRMEWEAGENLQVQLAFYGDIFETEDQRNWSDSSYKTYSTPLHLPFPALVMEGETMQQQVVVAITRNTKQQAQKNQPFKNLDKAISLPGIGYCRPANQPFLTNEQLTRIRENGIHHWRTELRLYENSWREDLLRAAGEASILQTKMELILFFKNEYEAQLHLLLEDLKNIGQPIYSVLLLDSEHDVTPEVLMRKGYDLIKASHPLIKVGYGTNGFFAELNRNRPGDLPHDFVSFSLTPMAHAKDARTIIENLDCQPEIISTIKSFSEKEIHISPLTISMRRGVDKDNRKNLSPAPGDIIEKSHFGRAWISFAIQQFSEADSITVLLSSRELP